MRKNLYILFFLCRILFYSWMRRIIAKGLLRVYWSSSVQRSSSVYWRTNFSNKYKIQTYNIVYLLRVIEKSIYTILVFGVLPHHNTCSTCIVDNHPQGVLSTTTKLYYCNYVVCNASAASVMTCQTLKTKIVLVVVTVEAYPVKLVFTLN